MAVLITGVAGFVGFHVARELLRRGQTVVGLDNLNDYYDVRLKQARLDQLTPDSNFRFERVSLEDRSEMERVMALHSWEAVIHLAAQAGVRYSLTNPHAYAASNLTGFLHVLEGCRAHAVPHLVYASSSSVYGGNTKMPFSITDTVDSPISLYAATKKANELMAHSYAHLYKIPCTGLRFFTVYGEWGRPDMAYFSFTKSIFEGKPIPVFNHGQMKRDFTYIDDVVQGVLNVAQRAPQPTEGRPPYALYNIGNHQPVELLQFIRTLEQCIGKPAQLEMLPMQPGDVPATYADVSELERDFDFRPQTPIETGLARFVDWYRNFYQA